MPALTIGLTGGLGTGKSTVLRMFGKLGGVTLSADRIAHRCLEPGTPTYRRILRHFGRKILKAGRIDRRRLGQQVFRNARARKTLEAIVHPNVKTVIQQRLAGLAPEKVAIVEVPLLFESGFQNLFGRSVLVWCSPREQGERLQRRNHFAKPEIKRRIQTQWPLSKKRRLADIVIDNSKGKKFTWQQVEKIWKDLKEVNYGKPTTANSRPR